MKSLKPEAVVKYKFVTDSQNQLFCTQNTPHLLIFYSFYKASKISLDSGLTFGPFFRGRSFWTI